MRKGKLFEGLLVRSWWVFLFMGICYLFYSQGVEKKRRDHEQLLAKLMDLEKEKRRLGEEKEDLRLQVKSQNDPKWIEMTLMKGLGLVPEGQVKIYFEKNEEEVP